MNSLTSRLYKEVTSVLLLPWRLASSLLLQVWPEFGFLLEVKGQLPFTSLGSKGHLSVQQSQNWILVHCILQVHKIASVRKFLLRTAGIVCLVVTFDPCTERPGAGVCKFCGRLNLLICCSDEGDLQCLNTLIDPHTDPHNTQLTNQSAGPRWCCVIGRFVGEGCGFRMICALVYLSKWTHDVFCFQEADNSDCRLTLKKLKLSLFYFVCLVLL